jgi:hypothetical protein
LAVYPHPIGCTIPGSTTLEDGRSPEEDRPFAEEAVVIVAVISSPGTGSVESITRYAQFIDQRLTAAGSFAEVPVHSVQVKTVP